MLRHQSGVPGRAARRTSGVNFRQTRCCGGRDAITSAPAAGSSCSVDRVAQAAAARCACVFWAPTPVLLTKCCLSSPTVAPGRAGDACTERWQRGGERVSADRRVRRVARASSASRTCSCHGGASRAQAAAGRARPLPPTQPPRDWQRSPSEACASAERAASSRRFSARRNLAGSTHLRPCGRARAHSRCVPAGPARERVSRMSGGVPAWSTEERLSRRAAHIAVRLRHPPRRAAQTRAQLRTRLRRRARTSCRARHGARRRGT